MKGWWYIGHSSITGCSLENYNHKNTHQCDKYVNTIWSDYLQEETLHTECLMNSFLRFCAIILNSLPRGLFMKTCMLVLLKGGSTFTILMKKLGWMVYLCFIRTSGVTSIGALRCWLWKTNPLWYPGMRINEYFEFHVCDLLSVGLRFRDVFLRRQHWLLLSVLLFLDT